MINLRSYGNDVTIKCGFEHDFRVIVPENANSTFDNAFMTGERSYKYYNEFMWMGRYAECISVEGTIKRMKGVSVVWKRLLGNTFNAGWIKILMR